MSKKSYIPLPDVSIEEHGVGFDSLALPVGFDEERLLVNVPRVNQLQRVGGLGNISLVGVRGTTDTYSAQISGVNENGEASLGLGVFRDKNPLVNGVKLYGDDEFDGLSLLYEPDVQIAMNTKERDARIDGSDSPKRHFDPQIHAKYINATLKQGISEAAKQRFAQTEFSRFRYLIGGVLTYGVIDDAIDMYSHRPGLTVPVWLGTWAATDAIRAAVLKKRGVIAENYPEVKLSMCFGIDRYIGSVIMAKTSRLVTVRQ